MNKTTLERWEGKQLKIEREGGALRVWFWVEVTAGLFDWRQINSMRARELFDELLEMQHILKG